ncbi:hypothetical protein HK101_007310 [Irineochytrium annulatum]|nr:hypothetical protein HK101_007310 [Irineochytrium annulatum]
MCLGYDEPFPVMQEVIYPSTSPWTPRDRHTHAQHAGALRADRQRGELCIALAPGSPNSIIQLSLYSGKTRAYLRHKGLDFDEALATTELYREVIIPRCKIAMIPVLVDLERDLVVQDTTLIADHLEKLHPTPSVTAPGAANEIATSLIEMWADEWLILPAMHYRWSFIENREFVFYEFGRSGLGNIGERTGGRVTVDEQVEAGRNASSKFKRSLPALGVHPESGPVIESQFRELVRKLDSHLRHHAYLFGARATIADFALMGPFYAHLFRDPKPGHLIKTTSYLLADYIERAEGITPSRGSTAAITGLKSTRPIMFERVEVDQVSEATPETLRPILGMILRDFAPVVVDTALRVRAHVTKERCGKGDALPRFMGRHVVNLFDAETGKWVKAERAVFPYAAFMARRCVGRFEKMAVAERRAVVELLVSLGDVPVVGGGRRKSLDVFLEMAEVLKGVELEWRDGATRWVGDVDALMAAGSKL